MFGRKKSSAFGQKPPAKAETAAPKRDRSAVPDGHRHVLEMLERNEAAEPLQRVQMAGHVLFDQVCAMIKSDKGINIETLLGVLASCGGYSCVLAALAVLRFENKTPKQAGMVEIETEDGKTYIFGDLPNKFLWESSHSLLSLSLGAAQDKGAIVSAAMVEDTMRHVASSVGAGGFGIPRMDPRNMPSDMPINFVLHIWPHLLKGLGLYEVRPDQWPASFGFAITRAINAGAEGLDPAIAAKLVCECAVPMAKLNPANIA